MARELDRPAQNGRQDGGGGGTEIKSLRVAHFAHILDRVFRFVCNRRPLKFQVYALRDIKMLSWEGSRVSQKMSFRLICF